MDVRTLTSAHIDGYRLQPLAKVQIPFKFFKGFEPVHSCIAVWIEFPYPFHQCGDSAYTRDCVTLHISIDASLHFLAIFLVIEWIPAMKTGNTKEAWAGVSIKISMHFSKSTVST